METKETANVNHFKFGFIMANTFKDLCPEKLELDFRGTMFEFDRDEMQKVGNAFLATLLEMEDSGDIPVGSGQKIFHALGLQELYSEAKDSDSFLFDVQKYFSDKCKEEIKDSLLDRAKEFIKK